MIETRNLVAFLEVAERKSFTRAAEALGYTQSTVSAQIKQLEEELDVQLFERINHKVSLTEEGKHLLENAQQVINILQEVQSRSAHAERCEGMVRFAMAPSICNQMMGETFMKFHQMYPDIEVKIIEADTDVMVDLLHQNDADLIYIVDRHEYNKEHMIAAEQKVEMHFVVSKDFPICGENPYSIHDLISYPFLLTEKNLSYRRLLDEKLAEKYLEINPIVEMGNTQLLLELVELGAGISFLPDYVTREAHKQGKIAYLEIEDLKVDVWSQLLYNKNKWISPAMKTVITYCTEIASNI